MMRRVGFILTVVLCGCMPPPELIEVPVETEFALINQSTRWYLTISIRETGRSEEFVPIGVLIPPGAVLRERFLEVLPESGGCPDRIDLRVYLFKRVNEDIPVGLDPNELIDPEPVASDQLAPVSVCSAVVASTFTMRLLDTPEGSASLKFAEDTRAEQPRTFEGVNPKLPELDPPPLLKSEPIAGQVIGADGTPQSGIAVLLRARVSRPAGAGTCPKEEDGLCFTDPIAIDRTDDEGRFAFERPPGAYMVEVFADCFCFRPSFVGVETPIDNIVFVAEKIECGDPENLICEEAPAP